MYSAHEPTNLKSFYSDARIHSGIDRNSEVRINKKGVLTVMTDGCCACCWTSAKTRKAHRRSTFDRLQADVASLLSRQACLAGFPGSSGMYASHILSKQNITREGVAHSGLSINQVDALDGFLSRKDAVQELIVGQAAREAKNTRSSPLRHPGSSGSSEGAGIAGSAIAAQSLLYGEHFASQSSLRSPVPVAKPSSPVQPSPASAAAQTASTVAVSPQPSHAATASWSSSAPLSSSSLVSFSSSSLSSSSSATAPGVSSSPVSHPQNRTVLIRRHPGKEVRPVTDKDVLSPYRMPEFTQNLTDAELAHLHQGLKELVAYANNFNASREHSSADGLSVGVIQLAASHFVRSRANEGMTVLNALLMSASGPAYTALNAYAKQRQASGSGELAPS